MLYILSPPMSMEALEISMSAQFITTTSVAFVTFTKNSQNHMVVDLNFAFFYINCIKGLIGRRGEKGEEGEGRMGERGGWEMGRGEEGEERKKGRKGRRGGKEGGEERKEGRRRGKGGGQVSLPLHSGEAKHSNRSYYANLQLS